MTAPTLATQTTHGRMYARERGGTPVVPSITTVQSVQDSEMGWWEAYCAAKAIFEDPRMAQWYSMDRDQQRSRKRDLMKFYQGAAERDRDAAAVRGDLIHNYAEHYALRILGRSDNADVQERLDLANAAGLQPYITQFHRFWDAYSPTPIAPEATVWNHTVGYAGTTDLICEINGVLVVLDYKTRKQIRDYQGNIKPTSLGSKIAMQLTAAARAEEYWIESADGTNDQWLPWPHKVELGVAVAIGPDDFVAAPYDIWHEMSWSTFVNLRQAWDWKANGASLVGGILADPSELRVGLFQK